MQRAKIQAPVNKSAVIKSGRWPRQYDGYRNCGSRGKGKAKTIRDFRSSVASK